MADYGEKMKMVKFPAEKSGKRAQMAPAVHHMARLAANPRIFFTFILAKPPFGVFIL
jgi:hypothetical protein